MAEPVRGLVGAGEELLRGSATVDHAGELDETFDEDAFRRASTRATRPRRCPVHLVAGWSAERLVRYPSVAFVAERRQALRGSRGATSRRVARGDGCDGSRASRVFLKRGGDSFASVLTSNPRVSFAAVRASSPRLSAGEPFADVASTVPPNLAALARRGLSAAGARSARPRLALAPLRFLRGRAFAPPRWPPDAAPTLITALDKAEACARASPSLANALWDTAATARRRGRAGDGGPSRDRVRRPRDPRARPRPSRARPRARRPQARAPSPRGTPRRCPRRGESRARTPLTPIQARTDPRARPRVRRRRPSVRRPTPPRGVSRAVSAARAESPGARASSRRVSSSSSFTANARPLGARRRANPRGGARGRPLRRGGARRTRGCRRCRGCARARCVARRWRRVARRRHRTRCSRSASARRSSRDVKPYTLGGITRARRPRRRRRRGTRWHRRRKRGASADVAGFAFVAGALRAAAEGGADPVAVDAMRTAVGMTIRITADESLADRVARVWSGVVGDLRRIARRCEARAQKPQLAQTPPMGWRVSSSHSSLDIRGRRGACAVAACRRNPRARASSNARIRSTRRSSTRRFARRVRVSAFPLRF